MAIYRDSPASDRMTIEALALITFFVVISYDNLNLLFAAVGDTNVIDLSIAKLAITMAMLTWLARALLAHDSRLFHILGENTTTLFVLAFVALSLISNINIDHHLRIPPGAPGPWTAVIRRMTLVMIYFAIIAVVRTPRLMGYMILAFVLGALVDCYAGIYEMITSQQFLDKLPWGRTELNTTLSGKVRIQGIENDGNIHTAVMLFGISFMPYLWHRASGFYQKVGVLLLFAVYLVNVVGSGSKGGWIALVLILALYTALADNPRKWIIAALCSIAGIVSFFLLSFAPHLLVTLEKFTGYTSSNTIRIGLMKMSLEMVKDHPFIGAGTGAFGYEYHRYYPYSNHLVRPEPLPAPNAYLQVWGENGTIGLILLLLIFGSAFLGAWVTMRNSRTAHMRILGVTVLILLVCTLWIISIYTFMNSKYLWVTLGLVVAYANLRESPPREADTAASSGP